MYKLKNTVFQSNISCEIALKLFDALMKPICTYCCEAWGGYIDSIPQSYKVSEENYSLFDENCFDKLELKFCKQLLSIY